ncbi:MAG: rubredoxin [Methylomarinum sp.]|nr:rubredoxin [Methylomarinum sp.]
MSKYQQYICSDCDFIYDEALGDPDSGIEPGTLWQDVPDNWICPECGVPKAQFSVYTTS